MGHVMLWFIQFQRLTKFFQGKYIYTAIWLKKRCYTFKATAALNSYSTTSSDPFFPSLPLRGLVDLIKDMLTFSLVVLSNHRQGHITGKWSFEQKSWQGRWWTGQWEVEWSGWDLGSKGSRISEMKAARRKKEVRNTDESRHPCMLFSIQMTLFTSSQQTFGFASHSVHHADSSSWATSVH